MKSKFSAIFIFIFYFNAFADLDPLSGARTSVFATQTLLASQPLPSLDGRDKKTIQISYFKIDFGDSDEQTGESYDGDFEGYALGYGWSSALRGSIGKYITVMVNDVTGTAAIKPNGPSFEFNTSGRALAAGYSLRMMGRDTHRYGIYMTELSKTCKKVTTATGTVPASPDCPIDSDASPADASFAAFGVELGWEHFVFNVFTQMVNDTTYDDLKIYNFTLNFSF